MLLNGVAGAITSNGGDPGRFPEEVGWELALKHGDDLGRVGRGEQSGR